MSARDESLILQINHLAVIYYSECGHKPTHIFLSGTDFETFKQTMIKQLEMLCMAGLAKASDEWNQKEVMELNMSIGKMWIHKSNIEDGQVGMGIEFTLGGEKK